MRSNELTEEAFAGFALTEPLGEWKDSWELIGQDASLELHPVPNSKVDVGFLFSFIENPTLSSHRGKIASFLIGLTSKTSPSFV